MSRHWVSTALTTWSLVHSFVDKYAFFTCTDELLHVILTHIGATQAIHHFLPGACSLPLDLDGKKWIIMQSSKTLRASDELQYLCY